MIKDSELSGLGRRNIIRNNLRIKSKDDYIMLMIKENKYNIKRRQNKNEQAGTIKYYMTEK